jgi:hypothetical protein
MARSLCSLLAVEVGEHCAQRTCLGQLLAEQPDGVGIGRRRAKIKAEEAQPTQPVPDQIFHPRITDTVLRRQHQDLEHRQPIAGRATALRAVAISSNQSNQREKVKEALEGHRSTQPLSSAFG